MQKNDVKNAAENFKHDGEGKKHHH